MRRVILFLTCLSLLLPAGAPAQDVDHALASAVRISGTRHGTPVRGSGFAVAVARDVATLVTASHVIEGARFEVAFAASATERFAVDAADVLGMESGNPNGLAVFQVRGAIPRGVTALTFNIESPPPTAEELLLVGFPNRSRTPLATRRTYTGRRGNLLQLDLPIGEGFSGGPVLHGGKVVGVVTSEDLRLTYAVNAVVAREFVAGSVTAPGGSAPRDDDSDDSEVDAAKRSSRVAVVALDPDGRPDLVLALGLVAQLLESGYAATRFDASDAELKALRRRKLKNLRLPDGAGYLLLVDWGGVTLTGNPGLADSITAHPAVAFEIYTTGGRLQFASMDGGQPGAGFSEDKAELNARSLTVRKIAGMVAEELP